MALKYQLESLEGLEESIASLYKKTDDGDYRLEVEGSPYPPDYDGLKNKVDQLLDEKKRESKRVQDAESQVQSLKQKYEEADEKLREALANGSSKEKLEALRNSYEEKLQRLTTEKEQEVEMLRGNITTMTVDNVALQLASELAVDKSEKVLLPHIKSRLAAEQRDGKYQTVVLDADGKPSAFTIDDLKTEFANDPAFAHVIVGSKASGGGADGGTGGGAAQKGNIAGDKSERVAAIAAKFPELKPA